MNPEDADRSEEPPAGEDDPPPAEVPSASDLDGETVDVAGPSEPARSEHRRVIAFAAGRGGAGKSLLAANVAIYLAQLGKRVVAVDADPAGGALHRLLGTTRPPRGYGELLRRRAEGLAELIVDTPVAGVGLVGSEAGCFGAGPPKQGAKAVLASLIDLEVDYVVLDLGQPDSPLCIDLWVAADFPVVAVLPDPASVEATYRFVKSGFIRRLRQTRGLDRLVGGLGGRPPAAVDLYRAAVQADGPAQRLAEEMAAYRPRFVVCQTRSLADLKLGSAMASAAQRRLGHGFEYLGHVESDEAVSVAARRHRPLMAEYPESKVAKNIEKIVRRLLAPETERGTAPAAPRLDAELTHYEVLETEPGVSDEEIRRAYRRVKEIYAGGSLAIAGLFEDHELTELHARANAAHDLLFAPERRRAYDLSLPEADLARAVRKKIGVPQAVDRPEPSDLVLDPELEVTGALLRKIREARGLEISDIAQRTKIGERHLRSIEEERFGDMPAEVYVRGFVMQFARTLRIDANRAVASYLRRYHQLRQV